MRTARPCRPALAAALCVALGCDAVPDDAVPKDAGFADVQRAVADRLGHAVQWRGVSADDAAVDRAVADLLGRPLTADAAVQVALLNNRSLQATCEDLGIARADLVQAGLLKNPIFTFDARFPYHPPRKTYLDVSVEDDFIDLFLRPLRQRVAADAFAGATARVAEAALQLSADTRVAFYDCQAAGQELELRRTVNQAQSDAYEAARRLYAVGNVNELSLLGEAAQSQRTRVQLAEAEERAAEARETLSDRMGVWGEQVNWTPLGRLADPPAGGGAAAAGLEALAVQRRPSLEAARQELTVQARTLGFTYSFRYLQSADLGPNAERETDGQWRIGPSVSAPVPLFDQGQAQVARAAALLRQAQDRFYAAAVDVRSDVRRARTRLAQSAARVEFYRREVLPTQARLLAQTQLHFNGMYVGVFDLLQARRDEADAGIGYIAALRDFWTAHAELERAVGGRLPTLPRPTTQVTP